jgi:hypothetical protein
VHAHVAEVVAEARLEEGAGGGVEGLAGRAKDFVHDRWNATGVSGFEFRVSSCALKFGLAALRALASHTR